jgi:hypothetical protein
MSPLGSRSLLRGASKVASLVPKRSMASKPASKPASEQVHPIGPFYEAILNKPQPISKTKPEMPPTTSTKSPRGRKAAAARKNSVSSASAPTNMRHHTNVETDELDPVDAPGASAPSYPSPSAEPATAEEKARIIFGTRLAGPEDRAKRLEAARSRSTRIAGVLVPPKPQEPDNCCMSGCVNCVWDLFRDEMEEWASASAEAERRLQAQREREQGLPEALDSAGDVRGVEGSRRLGAVDVPQPGSVASEALSMDDDGGGSETNWPVEQQPKIAKDLWDDELYQGVPVGIREFMKTEKKLKQRHEQDGTLGG